MLAVSKSRSLPVPPDIPSTPVHETVPGFLKGPRGETEESVLMTELFPDPKLYFYHSSTLVSVSSMWGYNNFLLSSLPFLVCGAHACVHVGRCRCPCMQRLEQGPLALSTLHFETQFLIEPLTGSFSQDGCWGSGFPGSTCLHLPRLKFWALPTVPGFLRGY